ncbi:LapA family protein [Campylobacter lanienae]|uniref:LapA family protein n=1 Tax=Campylobacter lanienae TaxID=75658 RepID=UPI0021BE8CCD|nr:LapA family protein [Campylobacter lanienae]
MKTRRFFLYSIIYIGIIWLAIFSFVNQNYALNILGYSLDIPIATWVVLPLILFAILALFHMSYYGFKIYLEGRAMRNDAQIYNVLAKEIYLGLESNKDFKTDLFNASSEVTKSLSPWLNLGKPNFENSDLKAAYEICFEVKNGKVCDLKKFKLLKTNPLYIQNEKNKIKADYKYAITILSNKETNDELISVASKALVENATFLELSKFNPTYTNSDIFILIDRYVNDKFEISTNDIFATISKVKFTQNEYIQIAKILKAKIDPDLLISMFERLKNEEQLALEAYLYLLYDFGMIDRLREIIASENSEFERIETLLFLRDHGKISKADLFY